MQHVSNVVPFAPAAVPVDIAAAMDPAPVTPEVEAVVTETPPEVAEPQSPPVVVGTKASALVNRAELLAAVAACTRAVERRNAIPVLANVCIAAVDGGLVVKGTDLDIVISAPVAGAACDHFATTLPAHTLADMLKRAKASEMVAIDLPDGRETAALDFDGLRVSLAALPVSDYPDLVTGKWSHSFTMPAADLARAFGKTAFAISTEETRYYLNGVYMHHTEPGKLASYNGSNGALCFVATDGHRLAKVETDAPTGCAGLPGVIIPRKTVAEVLRLVRAKGAPESVTVRVSTSYVQFDVATVTVTSKLIDGTFPDYSRVIPLGNDKALRVSAIAMTAAVEQVSVISSDRACKVHFMLQTGRVVLKVHNPDMGDASQEIASEYSGDWMDIGFNGRYMTDILTHVDSDIAEFMLADAGSPTLIWGTGDADKGVLFVLMPMRV